MIIERITMIYLMVACIDVLTEIKLLVVYGGINAYREGFAEGYGCEPRNIPIGIIILRFLEVIITGFGWPIRMIYTIMTNRG